MKRKKISCFVLSMFFLVHIVSSQVPNSEDMLGFKVGSDKKLADMHQIIDYFMKLDKASSRVVVREVGKTTMGNPFLVAIITSEKNHENLGKYREFQQRLADPRKITDEDAQKIISEGKAIVMVNCSIHASEIGASQMSMELAYDLAAKNDVKTKNILDNVILLLLPMHNPDGIQMVVDWYRKNLGTKYEGGRMPWLYHKYVGHDNNRDWYMFTQVESRLTLNVHNAWHPFIIVDMHQMGNRGARLFVPPYVDPYEPNIDPIIRQQVAVMGTFIASELTAQGKGGVMHSSGFDAWTPARAYHHYHGGIRILTEAASVKMATSITVEFENLSMSAREPSVKMPMPWKGGKWTLRDIVDYDYSAVMAALTNAARLRENWIRNFYRVQKKAVTANKIPYAFVIPAQQRDLSTAVKMMNVLRLGGVEIHQARGSFIADGYTYPAGTYIVYMAQPFGGFAKTLLERQVYPEIREYAGGPLKTPYDVVGHTLPLLMGVDVIQIEKPCEVKTVLLKKIDKPVGKVKINNKAVCYIWGHATNDDIVVLNRLLKRDYRVFWSAGEFEAGGESYAPGTMIVMQKPGLEKYLKAIAKDLYVHFIGLKEKPSAKAYMLKLPRLGLYKSWSASMDEGWTRWVLEQYEFAYKSVFNKDIRDGNLGKDFDVILLPDIMEDTIINGISEKSIPVEYSGGIGEIGVKNIREFIEQGGALIALNSASGFCIKRFNLGVANNVEKVSRKEFFVPGSLLKVLNDPTHPITFGYKRDAAIFFRRSPVFKANEGTSVVRYLANSLLSGWMNGEEYLRGNSAIVDVSFEKGNIILIGFPAQYRGQSHGSFRYLFNSIFYGAAEPGEI